MTLLHDRIPKLYLGIETGFKVAFEESNHEPIGIIGSITGGIGSITGENAIVRIMPVTFEKKENEEVKKEMVNDEELRLVNYVLNNLGENMSDNWKMPTDFQTFSKEILEKVFSEWIQKGWLSQNGQWLHVSPDDMRRQYVNINTNVTIYKDDDGKCYLYIFEENTNKEKMFKKKDFIMRCPKCTNAPFVFTIYKRYTNLNMRVQCQACKKEMILTKSQVMEFSQRGQFQPIQSVNIRALFKIELQKALEILKEEPKRKKIEHRVPLDYSDLFRSIHFVFINKPLPIIFKIDEWITLKLEDKTTNIYIKDKRFTQCKYLLFNLDKNKLEQYDEIASIDEAERLLNGEMERNHSTIPPETEFWGHCSNLQAWVENDYDTRILQRKLAFPLLEQLVKEGHSRALIRLKEEIMFRISEFKEDKSKIMKYFHEKNLLRYLERDDINMFVEELLVNHQFDKAKFWSKHVNAEFLVTFLKTYIAENEIGHALSLCEVFKDKALPKYLEPEERDLFLTTCLHVFPFNKVTQLFTYFDSNTLFQMAVQCLEKDMIEHGISILDYLESHGRKDLTTEQLTFLLNFFIEKGELKRGFALLSKMNLTFFEGASLEKFKTAFKQEIIKGNESIVLFLFSKEVIHLLDYEYLKEMETLIDQQKFERKNYLQNTIKHALDYAILDETRNKIEFLLHQAAKKGISRVALLQSLESITHHVKNDNNFSQLYK